MLRTSKQKIVKKNTIAKHFPSTKLQLRFTKAFIAIRKEGK